MQECIKDLEVIDKVAKDKEVATDKVEILNNTPDKVAKDKAAVTDLAVKLNNTPDKVVQDNKIPNNIQDKEAKDKVNIKIIEVDKEHKEAKVETEINTLDKTIITSWKKVKLPLFKRMSLISTPMISQLNTETRMVLLIEEDLDTAKLRMIITYLMQECIKDKVEVKEDNKTITTMMTMKAMTTT